MGSILAAGSFAVFFGGTFADGVVAALVAVLICFIQQKATKLFANTIMFNLFCSFVVGTVICLTVKVLPVLNMDKIMIGDIMLLIPGIPATNSIRDADTVLKRLQEKKQKGELFTEEDFAQLAIAPLMNSNKERKDVILESLKLSKTEKISQQKKQWQCFTRWRSVRADDRFRNTVWLLLMEIQ